MRAIIIDDEPRARALLQKMLSEYCPDVEVIADCQDLPNGVKAIRKLQPDVVFLDIEMPGHSGLEILDFFSQDEINFSIIFVTAYNQYAIRAFKLSALDYLLKPIEPADLEHAIERHRTKHQRHTGSLLALQENIKNEKPTKIAVPDAQSIKFLPLSEIVYFKADSSYTEIFFADNTTLVISRTLKNIEDTLDGASDFFRCHKSYLVNLAYVTDYIKSDGGHLRLRNKQSIPISSEKVEELIERTPFVKRK